jgi:hypothetical protein
LSLRQGPRFFPSLIKPDARICRIRRRRGGSRILRYDFINGLPSFVSVEADGAQTTALEIEGHKIAGIYVMRNPDKPRHLSSAVSLFIDRQR